jgi:hypothetical protein
MPPERPLPGWPAGVPEWLPIETAPRDGREVILGEPGDSYVGFYEAGGDYRRGEDGWWAEMDRGDLLTAKNMHPTHWLPLPAPPAPCGSSPRDGGASG